MLAALHQAGREPTITQWRIAMSIWAAGALIVVGHPDRGALGS
jgi:hypothetical protein